MQHHERRCAHGGYTHFVLSQLLNERLQGRTRKPAGIAIGTRDGYEI